MSFKTGIVSGKHVFFYFSWTGHLITNAFLSLTSRCRQQENEQSTVKILKISKTSMRKGRPCSNLSEECRTNVGHCVERWWENWTTQNRQLSLCSPLRLWVGQWLCLFKHKCDLEWSPERSCFPMLIFYRLCTNFDSTNILSVPGACHSWQDGASS